VWPSGETQAAIARQLAIDASVLAGLIARARNKGDMRFAPRPPGPRKVVKAATGAQAQAVSPSAVGDVANPTAVASSTAVAGPAAVVANLAAVAVAPRSETPVRPAAVPFFDLRHGACRWPVNDPPVGELMLFCSKAVAAPGANYCAAHRAMARMPRSSASPLFRASPPSRRFA